MTFPFELLIDYAEKNHIALPSNTVDLFNIYGDFLLEYNQNVNLTSITEPADVVIKHFIDSISLLTLTEISGSLIDVGTGAGFPGVPLLIARPQIKLTLLDSMRKRLDFLSLLSTKLGISPLFIHKRAEEAGQDKLLREQYDVVTARAVASLNLLAEYCLPLVKVGGIMAAMKGPSALQELESAQGAIRILGGNVEKKIQLILPDDSQRTIILIRKISQTSTAYPRPSAKIAKYPL